MGCGEASEKEGIQVPSQFSNKVMMYVEELQVNERKKIEVTEKKKAKEER